MKDLFGREFNKFAKDSLAYKPFTSIQMSSMTYKILYHLENVGPERYVSLRNMFVDEIADNSVGLDRTLRRLERTGLISRPKRGTYRITKKGLEALEELNKNKFWRRW